MIMVIINPTKQVGNFITSKLLLESYLPQYVVSFLKEEGLTMVEMDQVVRQTFFFHLFLDIDRREIDWFITQAERAPVYN